MIIFSLKKAIELLKKGEVLAYPTEAVFGLGCDPDNEKSVKKILSIKKRSIDKGLILIADKFERFNHYIDLTLIDEAQIELMKNSWDKQNITWIVPKSKNAPYYLTGHFNTIAIRVTKHPKIKKICKKLGKPLVSTSANISGLKPCRTIKQVNYQFNNLLVLKGKTLNEINPSKIIDLKTGKFLRI